MGILLLIPLGALLLLWTGFHNGYPLLYPDSGAYVTGLTRHRMPGYTYFIRFTQLFHSLWLPLFAQSLITSALLIRNAFHGLGEIKKGSGWGYAFAVLILTIAATAVSRYVSFLIPDIFASWIFLGGVLVFWSKGQGERFFGLTTVGVSILSHPSHGVIAIVSISILALVGLFFRISQKKFWQNLTQLGMTVGFACLLLGLLNLTGPKKRWELYRGWPNFLISKFATSGLLTQTLDAYCPQKSWKFCEYRETFRQHIGQRDWFLWKETSPREALGGWEKLGEHKEIIFSTARSFPKALLRQSLRDVRKQFLCFNSKSDLPKLEEGQRNRIYNLIQTNYRQEFESFKNSRQQQGLPIRTKLYPFSEEKTQKTLMGVAALLALIFLLRKDWKPAALLGAALLFISLNAAVMGLGASAIQHRYQGRVVWLVPYSIWVSLVSLYLRRRGPLNFREVESCDHIHQNFQAKN